MKKLHMHGFAHTVALALVIVGTGIVGTFFLVASHADSCSASAVSAASVVSGQGCSVSSVSVAQTPTPTPTPPQPKPPTPTPTQPQSVVSASCSISAMPNNPKLKQFITPAVTITNTGNRAFTATYSSTVWPQNKAGNKIDKKISFINSKVQSLQPGKSVRQSLQSYVVRHPANSNEVRIYFNVVSTSTPSFTCHSTSVKLP